jgi:hypothetical protein
MHNSRAGMTAQVPASRNGCVGGGGDSGGGNTLEVHTHLSHLRSFPAFLLQTRQDCTVLHPRLKRLLATPQETTQLVLQYLRGATSRVTVVSPRPCMTQCQGCGGQHTYAVEEAVTEQHQCDLGALGHEQLHGWLALVGTVEQNPGHNCTGGSKAPEGAWVCGITKTAVVLTEAIGRAAQSVQGSC